MPAPWRLPLFLVLGGLLFAVDLWRSPPEAPARRIQLTEADLALAAEELGYTDPSEVEPQALAAALDRRFETEVLVAEARRLGLDTHDVVVKRRLAQKLRFLLEGAVEVPEPTEAELEAWLRAHPEAFARPARLDLEQVFFSARVHGEGTTEVAAAALEAARSGGEEPDGGGAFVHGLHLEGRTPAQLSELFGPGFGEAVLVLPAGDWQGPVASTYGAHLLRVRLVEEGGVPELDEVRARVRQAWEEDRRRTLEREALEGLLARYERVGP